MRAVERHRFVDSALKPGPMRTPVYRLGWSNHFKAQRGVAYGELWQCQSGKAASRNWHWCVLWAAVLSHLWTRLHREAERSA
jgi:hypothetical protein